MPKNNEDFIHILLETSNNSGVPIKMRELELDELKELLKNKSIYLCPDIHPMAAVKNGEIIPVNSVCKIYHPNQGRNATFN
jgi:hypothetical protein